MDIIKLLVLALAPVFAIIIYVYFKDKYEKEPLHLLFKCFFWGVLSIIPALLLEILAGKLSIFTGTDFHSVALYAFVGVGLSEEFSKFIFLRFFAFKNKNFNEPFDGIIYAVMISMGFAATENILYVMEGGSTVAWLRMFTAVPAHAAFAVLMGYYVGKARFSESNRFLLLFNGLLIAVVFHGAYDLFLMLKDYSGLVIFSFITLVTGIILSIKTIKKSSESSPFKRWRFK
jgi:RsiW-degrading membrane proteinase PrsW (M82 family)